MGDNCVASIYSHVNGMNNNKISKQETTNVFQRLKFLKIVLEIRIILVSLSMRLCIYIKDHVSIRFTVYIQRHLL